jgi:hypothetical protein
MLDAVEFEGSDVSAPTAEAFREEVRRRSEEVRRRRAGK